MIQKFLNLWENFEISPFRQSGYVPFFDKKSFNIRFILSQVRHENQSIYLWFSQIGHFFARVVFLA